MKRVCSTALLTALAGTATAQVSSERIVIGTSSAGTPIEVFAIGETAPDAMGRTRDQRPAVLLVAGVDGTHLVGSQVATALIEALQRDQADLLAGHTVYIIPSLNPDGAAWLAGSPSIESGKVPAVLDTDGDRRTNEDGGDDLNGDGLITMMRVTNPAPGSGLTAEWIADAGEPRLMRKAEAEKGETPVYAVLIEGADNDGDGSFNEDGPGGSAGGGVDVDANFPSFWPEHRDDAGLYPTDRAESRALAAWVQGYGNIAAVVVYNTNDNLVNTPKTGQFDENGRMPKGLEKGDEAYHKHVAEAFKEATNMTGAATRGTEGSLASWAYSDLGLWTFVTPVWTRPDQVKTEDKPGDEAAKEVTPAEADPVAEPEVSEYDALIARGVPEEYARLLSMTAEEQVVAIASYTNMDEVEQQARMAEVAELPEDIRARLMGLAMNGQDPGKAQDGEEEAQDGDSKKSAEKSKADEAELAWLKYSDEEREGAGFVDWVEVEHPQLGTVEVGGFVPGFRINPPAAEHERLIAEQSEFLGKLLGMLPDLEFGDLTVESLGGGLHRVSLRVSDPGYLPTASAMGVKARRLVPIVAAVSVPVRDVIAGNRVQSVEQIGGSGGSHTFEWTVRADNAASLAVEIRSDHFGTHTVAATQGGAD